MLNLSIAEIQECLVNHSEALLDDLHDFRKSLNTLTAMLLVAVLLHFFANFLLAQLTAMLFIVAIPVVIIVLASQIQFQKRRIKNIDSVLLTKIRQSVQVA